MKSCMEGHTMESLMEEHTMESYVEGHTMESSVEGHTMESFVEGTHNVGICRRTHDGILCRRATQWNPLHKGPHRSGEDTSSEAPKHYKHNGLVASGASGIKKRMVFNTCLKSGHAKTIKKQTWNRGLAARKTR